MKVRGVMMAERLDRDVPVPLYYQIYQLLKQEIENKGYKPGDHYSTEMELQEEFNVSRATVRKALEMLEKDGSVNRITGKGIIIAPIKLKIDLPDLLSFSEEMKRRGMSSSNKLLDVSVSEPPRSVGDALGIATSGRTIMVRRVRYGDRIPIVYSESYIPETLGLTVEDDFSYSLYELIETKTGRLLDEARHVIEGALLDGEIAELLEVDEGFPALRFYRTVYDQNGKPALYEFGMIRADHYSYEIRLKRSGK